MVFPITLKQSSFSRMKNTLLIFATCLCSQKSIKFMKLKESRCLKPVTCIFKKCIILKDSISQRTINSQIWKRIERSSILIQFENSLHSISQRILPLPQLGEGDVSYLERHTIPLLNGSKGQQKSKGLTGLPTTSTAGTHTGVSRNKLIPLSNDPFQIF